MATLRTVRELALALPEVEEGTSYGTPAFFVRKKFFARMREDGETLVVYVPPVDRDFLTRLQPELFFITDHYRGYPVVLVRVRQATRAVLRERLETAWRMRAPKRLAALLSESP